MAEILIVGAGYVGRQLAVVLNQAGHRVTGLRRTPPLTDGGLRWITADLEDPGTLAGLEGGYEAVICAVAPGARDPRQYEAIFDKGVGNLLDALDGRTLPFLFVSSTGVYGCDDGSWVDEATPPSPTSATGRIMLAAEDTVLARRPGATVVRFSGIYGPERHWLIDRVRAGRPVQASPPSYTNRIHRDDCARVLAWLLSLRLRGESLPPRLLASDDDPAPLHEVTTWLAAELDVPAPPAESAAPHASRNKRCRNALLRDLGYIFVHPTYREGYTEVLGP